MINGLVDDRSGRLAVAELLLGGVRSRQTGPLLDQARGALDHAWTAIEERSEAGGSLMSEAHALEAAILERGRDDYTARAVAAVVYAVRSLTSRDDRWSKYVWDVTEELLEDINERAASHVSLSAVKEAIPRVEPTELRRWARARDILGMVQALRPTTPALVRGIARAASRMRPDVQVPAAPVALADARRRALEAVGVAAFAKALEPLAVALPLGELDTRWQPAADRILAAVAGTRISEVDQRLLISGFEAIPSGGSA